MKATYWQKGGTLDYTPTDDVENGQVVALVTRIGVAGNTIASGDTGTLHVEGVFEMDKATGAVAMGAALYYDETAENITTVASTGSGETLVTNVPAGYAAAAAASGDTTVLVKLLG